MTTITLIDNQQLFREGFRGLLSHEQDLNVVSEGNDKGEGLEAVRAKNPDLVIFDLLPGGGALQLARSLMADRSDRCLMALTASADDQFMSDALGAGVLGYASKKQKCAEVIAAIRQVARGESYLCPLFIGRPLGTPLAVLTVREREVFDLTIEGLPTAEVGRRLWISPRTVETHRARILRKLGAHSIVDLVRLAARLGLLRE
jgi:two-component system response regulator NreC